MDDLVAIRRALHEHPGISGAERFAHDMVVRELESLKPTRLHDHVGGYGVMAYWQSPVAGAKTLAFRADIDALPIGHRCGHDGHTAIMLCFARAVANAVTALRHNVLLVFQPEEETGRGAQKMLDSGLMQQYGVQAVFGLHNLPGYPKGMVVLNRHTFAAASTGVVYTLTGRATHASTPERGINPGLAMGDIVRRFSLLNSGAKSLEAFRQSTLIGCRAGEEAFGTSAGEGSLMFTLRSFTNRAMERLLADADAIVDDVARLEGLRVRRELREPFRATENTPALVGQLERLFDAEGVTTCRTEQPFRWSEDFADYLVHFPGAFFGFGSGEGQPELHHPDYDFPDDIIPDAAHCFELILNNVNLNYELN